ncbi:6899_t:CDS:1, partial [Gigaspora margarita]
FRQTTVLDQISNLFLELSVIMQNLLIQNTRGCPIGTKNTSKLSTQKDQFGFEFVEPEMHTKKCDLYQKTGYNSRICEQNNNK